MAEEQESAAAEAEQAQDAGAAPQDPQPAEAEKAQDAGSGEGTVNRHKYDVDIQRRDREIESLKRQLADSGKASKSAEDRIAELESRLDAAERARADEAVSARLSAAGCVDLKAAKARLEDFDGDVGRLKEAAPYLFGVSGKTMSTGGRPAESSADRRARARAAAGLK